MAINVLPVGPPGPAGPGVTYYAWSNVTGDIALVSGNGYIPDSDSLIVFLLPPNAAVGDHFKIVGFGAGGWTIAQNAGQTIHFNTTDTTTGTGGSIASQNRYDSIELVCVNANTDFNVVAAADILAVI